MRYETAAAVRKTIKQQFGRDLPVSFSVRYVGFADLARGGAFFVTLNWPKPGEFPVLAPEFKQRIYQMFREVFPKGSGVIVE